MNLIRTWEDPDGYGFLLKLYDTSQKDEHGRPSSWSDRWQSCVCS
jgi:hypothetical protein